VIGEQSAVGLVPPAVKPILATNNFIIVVAKQTSGNIVAPPAKVVELLFAVAAPRAKLVELSIMTVESSIVHP
jgi:hypothetical protein